MNSKTALANPTMDMIRTSNNIRHIFIPHIQSKMSEIPELHTCKLSNIHSELIETSSEVYICAHFTIYIGSQYTFVINFYPPKPPNYVGRPESAPIQWLEPSFYVNWGRIFPCPIFLLPATARYIYDILFLAWKAKEHDMYVFNGPLPGELIHDTKDIKEGV